MAHPELELISNIIKSGDFSAVRKNGITPEFFQTEEGAVVFKWLWDEFHSNDHRGEVPDRARLLRRFPDFHFIPSRNSPAALIAELQQEHVAGELERITGEIQALLDEKEDPRLVLQAFMPQMRSLSMQTGDASGLHMRDAFAQLRQEYDTVQNSGGITGIPYPWGPLNVATGGMHPEEFVVLYGRPKNMKCVVAGQKIMLDDGRLVAIEDVLEGRRVPSFTERTKKLRWASARPIKSGLKECVQVTTESGLQIETSTEHYFMVPEGPFEGVYERIQNLQPGDWVATTRNYPAWIVGDDAIENPHIAWLLGVLVGDGNYTRNEVQLTNEDAEIVQRVELIVGVHYDCDVRPSKSSEIEYRIASDAPRNLLLDYLRDLGIWKQSSKTKTIPDAVYQSSRSDISAFLAGLLDTDGTVWPERPYRLAWYSSSKAVAYGIQHLLTRFGVRGGISYDDAKDSFQVSVYGLEQHVTLWEALWAHVTCSRKREALRHLASERSTKRNDDGLPYSRRLYNLILAEKGNKHWPKWGKSKLSKGKLFRRTGKISRHLLSLLADAWDSEALRKEVGTQIRWERIKEIEPIGPKECYDIEIIDGYDPNFDVEGFLVHNTWAALKIAVHAYLHNYRVYIFSKEMNILTMARRCASIITELPYKELKQAELEAEDEEQMFDTLEALKDWENASIAAGKKARDLYFDSDKGRRQASSVDDLIARAEKFEPDLILVDGLYLMRDGRTQSRAADWKNIAHISQDLKGGAQYLGCPILGTTQANRANAKNPTDDGTDLSYADSLFQDADMATRVFKGPNPDGHHKYAIAMTFPGVREADLHPFMINAAPGNDFDLIRTNVDMKSFLESKKVMDREEEAAQGGDGTSSSAPKKKEGAKKRPRSRKKPSERFRA